MLTHLTNEELLKRYQEADTAAFEEFFNRHRRLVFHYLYSKLNSVPEAEEAFQKTFFRVHRYILNYDPDQSALGWVMAIARNVALDLRPTRAPALPLEDVPSAALSTEPEGALEARAALEALLAKLEPAERRLIERRFLNDDSFEQIAREEGWTVVNTRQKISRLLRRLRSELVELSV